MKKWILRDDINEKDSEIFSCYPEVISKGIFNAIKKKKETIYLPFFWRYIMLIIKFIPEKIFKHLKL